MTDQKDPNFLLNTMDAQVWATEYCRLNPGADIGNMIGWFANAIMVGFDEANRRNQAKRDALLTQNTGTTVEQDVIDALRGSGFDVRGETADAIVYGTAHHGALLIDAAIQAFWNKSGCDEHFDIDVPPFCPICMHVETEKKKVFPFSGLMRDWKTGTKSAQDVCAELFHYFCSEPAFAERTTAPVSLTDDDLTQEFSLDAIIKGIRYADHGRHEGWQAELKEYIRIECNRAILAAAPAPIQQEPVSVDNHVLTCWACQKQFTMAQRSDADGNCPHCMAEYELNEAEVAMIRGRKVLADDLGWLGALGKYAQNPSFDQAVVVTEYADNFYATSTPPALAGSQVQAAGDVLAERERQKQQEGWTDEHDDQYEDGELCGAAACYTMADDSAQHEESPNLWPWPEDWWKPTTKRRNLVKAGALILAEIERLDRAAMREQQP